MIDSLTDGSPDMHNVMDVFSDPICLILTGTLLICLANVVGLLQ